MNLQHNSLYEKRRSKEMTFLQMTAAQMQMLLMQMGVYFKVLEERL